MSSAVAAPALTGSELTEGTVVGADAAVTDGAIQSAPVQTALMGTELTEEPATMMGAEETSLESNIVAQEGTVVQEGTELEEGIEASPLLGNQSGVATSAANF